MYSLIIVVMTNIAKEKQLLIPRGAIAHIARITGYSNNTVKCAILNNSVGQKSFHARRLFNQKYKIK